MDKLKEIELNKDLKIIISTQEGLEKFVYFLKELEKESISQNPFVAFEYMEPLIKNFFSKKNLYLIFILRQNKPIFFAALIKIFSFVHGIPLIILRSCSNEEVPVFDCLIRKAEDINNIWDYFLDTIYSYFKWDIFIRKHVYIEDSACRYLYKVALNRNNLLIKSTKFSSPFIRIAPKTWDEYITTISSNARQDFRRKLKKIEALGGWKTEVYTHLDDRLERGIDDMFLVAAKGWAAKGETAVSSTSALKDFYRQITLNFARKGALRLYILKSNNVAVAFMLNILHKRICYFLKTAYDPSYKKFSPGTILLSNAIKDCFDMNLEEFNLCGIPERYKVRWANAHREVGDIFIFNNTLIGRLAYLQEKLIIPFLRKTIQYRY